MMFQGSCKLCRLYYHSKLKNIKISKLIFLYRYASAYKNSLPLSVIFLLKKWEKKIIYWSFQALIKSHLNTSLECVRVLFLYSHCCRGTLLQKFSKWYTQVIHIIQLLIELIFDFFVRSTELLESRHPIPIVRYWGFVECCCRVLWIFRILILVIFVVCRQVTTFVVFVR